ncbi:hypothetical protein ACHAXT_011689 [Thalassiosira profunda]
MTKPLHVAIAALLLSMAAAQERPHQRRIPHRPDRPSIREMVERKYERHEETLTNILKQRQAAVDDHLSGRKLLQSDEELEKHQKHIKGLHRKLAAHRQKDPEILKLEMEEEMKLQERMLAGEFIWTPGSDELVLKEP